MSSRPIEARRGAAERTRWPFSNPGSLLRRDRFRPAGRDGSPQRALSVFAALFPSHPAFRKDSLRFFATAPSRQAHARPRSSLAAAHPASFDRSSATPDGRPRSCSSACPVAKRPFGPANVDRRQPAEAWVARIDPRRARAAPRRRERTRLRAKRVRGPGATKQATALLPRSELTRRSMTPVTIG